LAITAADKKLQQCMQESSSGMLCGGFVTLWNMVKDGFLYVSTFKFMV
jgi:hypothetical protein